MFNDEKLLKLLEAMAVNESSYGFDLEVVRITLRYMKKWNQFLVQNRAYNSRCYQGLFDLTDKLKDQKLRKNVGTSNSSSNGGLLGSGSRFAVRDTKRSRRNRRKQQGKKRSGFLNDSADESVYRSVSTTSGRGSSQRTNLQPADRKYRIPQIDLKKEGPKISQIISDSLAAAVALQNALIVLPSGMSALDDENCTSKFIQARAIRRKVLRYLQLVTEGDYLGSLLYANDELVKALTLYDDKSGGSQSDVGEDDDDDDDDSYDSDSDFEEEQVRRPNIYTDSVSHAQSVETDPFADHNVI